jgi:hypothetical protein
MPQDPWQRANDLARLREVDARLGPPKSSRRAAPGPVLALLLVLLAAGAAVAWLNRDRVLEAARPVELPEPAKEVLARLDEHPPDMAALDKGLGVYLRITGDYKDVIAASRDWGVEWKLSSIGGGRQRLEAPGVEIGCANEKIQTYTVDIDKVFAEPAWSAWAEELKAAGFYPQQRYKDVLGVKDADGEELWLHRSRPLSGERSAFPAYRLRFRQGQLVELLGAIEFDSGGQVVVHDKFVPSDDAMAAELPRIETPEEQKGEEGRAGRARIDTNGGAQPEG